MTSPGTSSTAPAMARRSDFVRRRRRVIDAFLDLVLEGERSPASDAIAERAGVSRASFFRYFATLEELRTEAMGRVFERFLDLFDLGEPPSSQERRVAHFVDARLRFHEILHPLALLQRRHAADSDHAAAQIDASRLLLADQLRSYFRADLQHLTDAQKDDAVTTIAVLTSVESWQQATHSHARTPAQIRRAWRSAILAVLDAAATSMGRGSA